MFGFRGSMYVFDNENRTSINENRKSNNKNKQLTNNKQKKCSKN